MQPRIGHRRQRTARPSTTQAAARPRCAYDLRALTFPVDIPLGSFRLPAHAVFELLAYAVGFRLYLAQRRRLGDALPGATRWSIVAAAIAGAAVGARALYWLEDPAATLAHWREPAYLLGGKTVVGALLGGTMAVEWTKWWIGERRRTGDLFAVPLAVGMAIGRVGCFLGGLPDRTYGLATALPWGVDFGDGVARHPTQIYEAVALAALALGLARLQRKPHVEGDVFRVFLVAYLALRLVVDAIKPGAPLAVGLTAIQWAAVGGLLYYVPDIRRWMRSPR
ncbi:MAG: prolipoprotein diacylglyceryl transferase [Vicinamibacterales bacterium]